MLVGLIDISESTLVRDNVREREKKRERRDTLMTNHAKFGHFVVAT